MSVSSAVRGDGRRVVRTTGPWTPPAAAEAVAGSGRTGGEVLVTIDERAHDERAVLEAAGFRVARTETLVEIALEDAIRALAGAELPEGVADRETTQVDPVALWRLDDELRGDVPGMDGWQSSLEAFRAETFGDPAFDNRTYRVAVELGSEQPIGIVRVWMNPTGPRIGLWGVRRRHRRRGIAAALLRTALGAANETDGRPATTEYDVTNVASAALAARIGARERRRLIELRYPPSG